MKRIVIFVAFLVIAITAMAQNGYRPMLKEGRMWVEMGHNEFDRYVYNVRVGEDTIINNMKYYRIYEQFSVTDDAQPEYSEGFQYDSAEKLRCLLREENHCIYRWAGEKDERLYVFSLPVDMSLSRPGNYTQTVKAIDTIDVDGSSYRRMSICEINWENFKWLTEKGLDPDSYERVWMYNGYWVEGIGSSRGVTQSYKWLDKVGTAGGMGIMFHSCYDNGKLIFRYSDFESPGFCPMLKQGKSWIYDSYHYNEDKGKYDDPVRVSFVIDGDTLINGKSYYRLFNYSTLSYYCALREEGTTLYCVSLGEQQEKVLQEFDPSKFPGEMGEYTVQKDTITVRDTPFVRYQYKPENNGKPMTAVEGVGFKDKGIVYGMYPSEGSDNFSDYMKFRYCVEDGRVIFMNDEFDTQQTNDIKDLYHTANAISRKISNSLFDLQGRRITGIPSRGVYIKDGKKYVKK